MKLRRDSLRRRKSAQATNENACSLWRSPTSQQPGVDANKLVTKNGDPATAVEQRLYLNGLHRTVGLPQQVTLWGTPADYSRGGGRSRSGKRIGELLLPGQAKMWATPRAEERCQQNSRDDYVALSRQAPLWPTLRTPDYESKPVTKTTFSKNSRPLNEVVCRSSRLDLGCETHGGKSSKSTRRLNPRFVAWLMGWPLTDFGFSEMEWFHWRQRMRSSLFGLMFYST